MSQESIPDLSRERGGGWMKEQAIKAIFFSCAALSILTTVGIVLALAGDALTFFTRVSPVAFFTNTEWHPTIQPYSFGVLPLIAGTLIITIGSAVIALPLGVLTAIYLSEYASDRMRSVLKPALEILAGIPTVVYGYFALVYITPALSTVFPTIETFNALSASIIVGIMIIPMVSSISEDAMNSVPDSLRQAGYGLGATKFEVSTGVVVPSAISGILSSFILALSRAIGETMAVTIAAGRDAELVNPFNPEAYLGSVETMTAAMVELGSSDVTGASTAYKSLFAIGLTLFVITLGMNMLSEWISSRYREVYE
ncbi:phosphate ABC transporter permease subunit PstC [Halorussus sp. AFM4]|uniref:phosphate ABC transporter permease subunit PstC n=1 Tax=Halorussus sp. AFM4 TaxID=3421651 RepID=UPI003EBCC9E6